MAGGWAPRTACSSSGARRQGNGWAGGQEVCGRPHQPLALGQPAHVVELPACAAPRLASPASTVPRMPPRLPPSRCRYLEEAGCASVCINSCKVPTQVRCRRLGCAPLMRGRPARPGGGWAHAAPADLLPPRVCTRRALAPAPALVPPGVLCAPHGPAAGDEAQLRGLQLPVQVGRGRGGGCWRRALPQLPHPGAVLLAGRRLTPTLASGPAPWLRTAALLTTSTALASSPFTAALARRRRPRRRTPPLPRPASSSAPPSARRTRARRGATRSSSTREARRACIKCDCQRVCVFDPSVINEGAWRSWAPAPARGVQGGASGASSCPAQAAGWPRIALRLSVARGVRWRGCGRPGGSWRCSGPTLWEVSRGSRGADWHADEARARS